MGTGFLENMDSNWIWLGPTSAAFIALIDNPLEDIEYPEPE